MTNNTPQPDFDNMSFREAYYHGRSTARKAIREGVHPTMLWITTTSFFYDHEDPFDRGHADLAWSRAPKTPDGKRLSMALEDLPPATQEDKERFRAAHNEPGKSVNRKIKPKNPILDFIIDMAIGTVVVLVLATVFFVASPFIVAGKIYNAGRKFLERKFKSATSDERPRTNGTKPAAE